VENIQKIKRKLTQLGYSNKAQAAILANAEVETGGTFDPAQQQTSSKGGKGHGIFQFDFMHPYYQRWKGGEEDTIEKQIDFMHEVIQGDQQDLIGKGNAKKLRAALDSGDVKTATKGFMNIFEKPGKPHTNRRLEAADKHLAALKEGKEGLTQRAPAGEPPSTLLGKYAPTPRKKPRRPDTVFSDMINRVATGEDYGG
jgi:hypothetical protein